MEWIIQAGITATDESRANGKKAAAAAEQPPAKSRAKRRRIHLSISTQTRQESHQEAILTSLQNYLLSLSVSLCVSKTAGSSPDTPTYAPCQDPLAQLSLSVSLDAESETHVDHIYFSLSFSGCTSRSRFYIVNRLTT